ncbi:MULTISPECIES: hypothetical protein [unclassified Streptomyces]|uniref:hypothetical protein n=1 Tax=unclassified Streptomyces TaxID=2593676 RepID=UPI0037033EBB
MTSPTPARAGTRRRLTLAAAATATLTATLAVTACSSTTDSTDGKHTPTPTTASATTPTATATTPTHPPTSLEGNWLATTNGKAVVLVITDTKAALFTTGGTVCSGETEPRTTPQSIHLKCGKNAAGTRTTGQVDSVNKTTLKVTWQGDIGTETYTRSEGGKAPTFFPTEGLGQ